MKTEFMKKIISLILMIMMVIGASVSVVFAAEIDSVDTSSGSNDASDVPADGTYDDSGTVSVWLYLGENGVLELPGSNGKWTYSQEWYYMGKVPEGETVKSYVTGKKGADYYAALSSPEPYNGSVFSGWYMDEDRSVSWDMDADVISADKCHMEDVMLQDVGGTPVQEKTLNLYADWDVKYKRIYGNDRYSTAYKVAEELASLNDNKQAEVAVIADGRNYPDALSGSYLAKAADAPVLLADKRTEDELIAQIYSDVNMNGTIYILGGSGAVSESLEASLSENYDVRRLAGIDRYETNLRILEEGDRLLGDKKRPVMICTGTGFADSLSASATGDPILLVDSKITDEQAEYISSLSGRTAYMIGGPKVVSDSVKKEYEKLTGEAVERLYGKDRYDTSLKIAERFFDRASSAVLVCGTNFPDGLSGSPLAMRVLAPVLLVGRGDSAYMKSYLDASGTDMLYVLGGPSLIADSVVQELVSIGNGDENISSDAERDTDGSGFDGDIEVRSKQRSLKGTGDSIDEQLEALDLDDVNNVMIIAHPDDETFWGGAHLLEDDYLVVCITNGTNAVRKKEFMSAIQYSDDKGIILDYPDINNGVKSKWQECQDRIYDDLCKVLEYKDWDVIATHNPDGEYGHIHHKITDRLVTRICGETEKTDRLFYFEKYFDRNKIPQNFRGNVSDAIKNRKHEMAVLYASQYIGYLNRHIQMEPYEFWMRADKWDQRNKIMTRVYTDTEYK